MAAWKIGALDLTWAPACLPKKTCVLLESRALGYLSECAAIAASAFGPLVTSVVLRSSWQHATGPHTLTGKCQL